jgi:hypothetical protein
MEYAAQEGNLLMHRVKIKKVPNRQLGCNETVVNGNNDRNGEKCLIYLGLVVKRHL